MSYLVGVSGEWNSNTVRWLHLVGVGELFGLINVEKEDILHWNMVQIRFRAVKIF